MKNPNSFASSYPLEILIADDDTIRRVAMKQQLAELGYKPEEAASDSEVLSKAAARRYDVIMMQVLIPGIDGILDLARPKAGQKPIFIAISSSSAYSKEERVVSLPTQIDSVITRPTDRPELLLQLKACSVLAGKCFIKSGR
ncbi:MAG TPA: response regulator [Puia sp.]|nr:response regulator [Puia sp.]